MKTVEEFISEHFKGLEKETWYPAIVGITFGYWKYCLESGKEFPSQKEWGFISNNEYPDKIGTYIVMDRYGKKGWALWATSGAPNEPVSFFNIRTEKNEALKQEDIICWKKH